MESLQSWRKSEKQRLTEPLAIPDIGSLPGFSFNTFEFIQRKM